MQEVQEKVVARSTTFNVRDINNVDKLTRVVARNHKLSMIGHAKCSTYHERFHVTAPVVNKEDLTSNVYVAKTAGTLSAHKITKELLEAVEDTAELMQWHQKLNHLYFTKIKILAATGILASLKLEPQDVHAAFSGQ